MTKNKSSYGIAEISRRRLLQVKRAKHSVGETWLLRKELRQCYGLIDDDTELCDLDTDVFVKGKRLLEVDSTQKGIIKKYVPSPTVLRRAQLIILENRISLVPEQKCFAITSTSDLQQLNRGHHPLLRRCKVVSQYSRWLRNDESESKVGNNIFSMNPYAEEAEFSRLESEHLKELDKEEGNGPKCDQRDPHSHTCSSDTPNNDGSNSFTSISSKPSSTDSEKERLSFPSSVEENKKDNSKVLAEESGQQPQQENIIQFQEKQDYASSMLEDLTQLSENSQLHSDSPKKHRKIESSAATPKNPESPGTM
ncbi:hypothetical protein OUZ56_005757 [Daphnia magna]|uniref:Uncharacterized protein n=1 Tax=Daphnia magna TaxID=35525 RepID=A0ABQ9YTR5_9CRUS|nr:hypothetical protein OUZ56_005757 [Daphnia magna]